MHDEEHLSGEVVMIATGDKKLGKVIGDAICKVRSDFMMCSWLKFVTFISIQAAEKGGRKGGAPLVFTDSTPYGLIVRRFLDKELKQVE